MESIIPEKSAKNLNLVDLLGALGEDFESVRQVEEALESGVIPSSSIRGIMKITGFVIKEIDNIFVELTEIDAHISESQAGIDDLKMETREMLAELSESIV